MRSAESARLSDSAVRQRIVNEIDASDRDWNGVMIGGTWHADTKAYSGKTVAEILNGSNVQEFKCSRTAGDVVCEILEKDLCRTGAFFFGMSEENLAKIYSRPWVVPGSDASLRAPWGPLGADWPHPRAYGTMPEFYRRVRALGFSREETVARMTSVPARRFGIRGRGVLEKGAFADLVIWNESAFKANATYADPHRFSSGVTCAMVNGSIPYRDGKFTGDRAGRFLERG